MLDQGEVRLVTLEGFRPGRCLPRRPRISSSCTCLPPVDVPGGTFSACSRCGGSFRCGGCPRPAVPNGFLIDEVSGMDAKRLGGRIYDKFCWFFGVR